MSAEVPEAERYYTARELAGLPGLPTTERRVRSRAEAERWESRNHIGRGGGSEYAHSSLPQVTQIALLLRTAPPAPVEVDPHSRREHGQHPVSQAQIEAAGTATLSRHKPVKRLRMNA